MRPQAILLDKDGTLIDFDLTWGPAAYEVMRALAGGTRAKLDSLMQVSRYLEPERRFLPDSPLVGGSSAEYGPLWAAALGRPPDEALYGEMDDLFRHWGLATLSPIGEPAAILAELAGRGLPLGIATNDAEASARAQASALGLDPYLACTIGYDSGFGSKPDPGMVTAFARHVGRAARSRRNGWRFRARSRGRPRGRRDRGRRADRAPQRGRPARARALRRRDARHACGPSWLARYFEHVTAASSRRTSLDAPDRRASGLDRTPSLTSGRFMAVRELRRS
jgi:phosphoglycolate phosphatase